MNLIRKLIEYNNLQVKVKSQPRQTPYQNKRADEIQNTANDDINNSEVLPNKSTKVLGAGIDAIVFHNDQKPQQAGVITKWVRQQLTDYNSNPVIQYLVKGNSMGNPFIPVVYEIKQHQTNDEFYEYFIKMEKLHNTLHRMNLDSNQVLMLLTQIIPEYDGPKIRKEELETLIEESFYDLSGLTIGNKLYKYNENYLKTLKLIRNIVHSSNSNAPDMHSNNIMIRLTSVGMQLVIIDPIVEQILGGF